MLKLPSLPARDVALVTFPFGVLTRDAYAWLDDARHDEAPEAVALSTADLATWGAVSRVAHNDFEPVVAARTPDIASTLLAVRAAVTASGDRDAIALLAGSGATVFLLGTHLPGAHIRVDGVTSRTVRTRTADRVVAVEVSG